MQLDYELIEILKNLLQEAKDATMEISATSKVEAKPAKCEVLGGEKIKFQLYFDGRSERKLRIQKLDKDYCIVHAWWRFDVNSLWNKRSCISDSNYKSFNLF